MPVKQVGYVKRQIPGSAGIGHFAIIAQPQLGVIARRYTVEVKIPAFDPAQISLRVSNITLLQLDAVRSKVVGQRCLAGKIRCAELTGNVKRNPTERCI